ncbi:MAG TPA: acyl-CoA dehydrogenase family protein [bacterium]|nr:acyl-CoA dehydrogenase family protein [bacterium]
MNFGLTDDQKQLVHMIEDFCKKETSRELDRECDENERYPLELNDKLIKTGLYGLPFPEKYGGTGGSTMDFCLAVETLAKHSEAACALFLLPVFFAGEMILNNASEEQKQKFLPEIIGGRLKGCFALTEPNAGSDASRVTTRAVADGGDYVLNGHKTLITGAEIADYIMVVTKTNLEVRRYEGISIFMVPRETKGITINKLKKLGGRIISTCEIFLEDVRVPKELIMGGPEGLNKGWPQMLMQLDIERIMMGAAHVALAEKAFDDALAYAKQREQFGKPISTYQMVVQILADMKTQIEAARWLTYRAAWLKDQKLPCSLEASYCKLFSTEMAKKVTQDGMQVMGGYGYMMEYDMQRYVRDALLGTIGGGTNQIQRLIIGKLLGCF